MADPNGKFSGRVAASIMLGGLLIGLGIGWWVVRANPINESESKWAANQSPLVTTLPAPANVDFDSIALSIGSPAPDFKLPMLEGGQVNLSHYEGQPVLINFWASWCPPCRLEMPDLVRAYQDNRAKGFVLLGINLTFQDSLIDVQAFVKEFDMTFPVVLDETSEVTYGLYHLRGLPTSVFVDRAGDIVRIQIGAMTGAQIDEFVGEILK